MALQIDAEIERLAIEIAEMTGESPTETVRRLLLEQKSAFDSQENGRRMDGLMRWLQEEVWPTIPEELRGPTPKVYYDALYK